MQMIAEILSVGTELLMGQIANTDAQYLSRGLGELGINIYRHSTVGDNPGRVRQRCRRPWPGATWSLPPAAWGPRRTT